MKKKQHKEVIDRFKLLNDARISSLVYYGPHPCQKCDPKGKKGTMIVKAGNGASNKLQFDFVHGSHYPNHQWQQHKCIDITK